MSDLSTGGVHHLRLTVTDVERARQFYTDVLGFQVFAEIPPGVLLTNGTILLGLGPPPHPEQAIATDRFSEDRVGLDHLSFSVNERADLERAVQLFDERGVPHGEITDMASLGLSMLFFRDPDNVQLELTAPLHQ